MCQNKRFWSGETTKKPPKNDRKHLKAKENNPKKNTEKTTKTTENRPKKKTDEKRTQKSRQNTKKRLKNPTNQKNTKKRPKTPQNPTKNQPKTNQKKTAKTPKNDQKRPKNQKTNQKNQQKTKQKSIKPPKDKPKTSHKNPTKNDSMPRNHFERSTKRRHTTKSLRNEFVAFYDGNRLSANPFSKHLILAFLLCDLGVGRQTKKRGVPRWWCTIFPPKWVIFGVLALQKQAETFEGFGRLVAHSFYLSEVVSMPPESGDCWNFLHKQGFRVARLETQETLKMAKICRVSRLERQFATLYLFRTPTPPPRNSKNYRSNSPTIAARRGHSEPSAQKHSTLWRLFSPGPWTPGHSCK